MTLLDTTSRTQAERVLATPSARLAPEQRVSWLNRSLGSWAWTTRSDWARRLHENGCPDWANLAPASGATKVKENDGRQVWRVELDDELVFAKLYLPPRGWLRLRRWLLGSDSSRERRVAEYARRHRISTVQPIASADCRVAGAKPASILLTHGLPHAIPLNEAWASLSAGDPAARQRKNLIVDCVARLVAHAHQNGFEHTDLHAGNILLDRGANDDYQAVFVDLHNIRIGRPVGDRAVVRNLAQFQQWFRSRAPLTDRLRFLDRYLHWRDVFESTGAFGRQLGWDVHELRAALDEAAHAHAGRLFAKRDRRSMRAGRYFTRLRLRHGWRGYAFLRCKHPVPGSSASIMSLSSDQWRTWLAEPLGWFKADRTQYAIKKSASSMVSRCQFPMGDASLHVVCKRSMPRHLGKRIKNLLRQSRALRTWRLGNALLNRQIPTARPLAVVERRTCGILLDSLIVTEYIAHAHDLDTLLTVQTRTISAHQQWQLKGQVAKALAALVRIFHDRGFIHRDFKAPNIMVQWDPQGSTPPRILLVDLDGVYARRRPSRQQWLRAMMRLNVSVDHCRRVTRTDRLRFLKACLVRPGRPQPEWKSTWQDIAQLSERKRKAKNLQFERMMAKYGRI